MAGERDLGAYETSATEANEYEKLLRGAAVVLVQSQQGTYCMRVSWAPKSQMSLRGVGHRRDTRPKRAVRVARVSEAPKSLTSQRGLNRGRTGVKQTGIRDFSRCVRVY